MGFYRFVMERVPGVGTIERQINLYDGKLFVIKAEGYYGFFFVSPKGVYICNGGLIRKTGPSESLQWYYDNFLTMVDLYITLLSPLRRFQEKISAVVKSIGGSGKIHGTIVDVDFSNHIMVNTEDGTVKYYNSPFLGIVRTYDTLAALLQDNCPELEKNLKKTGAELVSITGSGAIENAISPYQKVDIKNSPYAISARVNALQRLFDKHILRDWDSNLLEALYSKPGE